VSVATGVLGVALLLLLLALRVLPAAFSTL